MQLIKKYVLDHRNALVFVALILCGWGLYLPSVQSKNFYANDDKYTIQQNQTIRNVDIPKIFHAFNTRFLVGLTFALDYGSFGLEPFGYRAVNLLIHCLNAFLVYLLVAYTLKLCSLSPGPAVFAGFLFLCHPIETEAVNYITQRFVLMGTLFYLLTIYLYARYRSESKKQFLFAALVSALAAMFCKEFVVTLPVMTALYEFYFLGHLHDAPVKRWRCLAPFFAIALIIPALLLATPKDAIDVANIADSSSSHVDITRAHGGVGRGEYFLTELNVLRTYVRLLFLPLNQNFDYDYPFTHALDLGTFCSAMFLVLLLLIAVWTYKSNRMISFGILWFFVALSVESSIIPIKHVIAEYRLYLASAGFVFLVTALVYSWQADIRKLNIIAAVIAVICATLSYQRNLVWANEISLWSDTITKSPHKPLPYINRGLAYNAQDKYSQAIDDFNRAIAVDSKFAVAYNNRGTSYYHLGNFNQAFLDYNKAIELNPKFDIAYQNRQLAYYVLSSQAEASKPDYDKSIMEYTKAIALNPKDASAYNNRGVAYDMKGDYDKAISDYTKAIKLNPKLWAVYYNRAHVYFNKKEYDKARGDVKIAVKSGMTIDQGLLKGLKMSTNQKVTGTF